VLSCFKSHRSTGKNLPNPPVPVVEKCKACESARCGGVACQVVTVVMTCDFFDFWRGDGPRAPQTTSNANALVTPPPPFLWTHQPNKQDPPALPPHAYGQLAHTHVSHRLAPHSHAQADCLGPPQATTSTTSKNGRGRGVCQGMECPAGGLRQDPGPRSDAARYVCGGGVFELLASPSILYSNPLPLIPCCHPALQVPSSATRTRAWPKPWQIFRPASPLPRKPSKSKAWAL